MKAPTQKLHSLIDKVYAPLTLRRAYAKGARRGSAPGLDGVTWKSFRQHLQENLTALSWQIKSGQYRPVPFRTIQTEIYTREPLDLCIPSVRDRIVEHAIRMKLEPLFEAFLFFPFTAGYRPGRSRVTALQLASALYTDDLAWAANIEINHLAESVHHQRLLDILATFLADGKLLRLIEQDWQGRNGLPNGSALTPFLCNVYLHAIDVLLQQEHVVRFSNIYLLFYRTREEAEQALIRVIRLLEDYHLAIKPQTTGIVHQPQIENLFLFDGLLVQQRREAPDVPFG